MTQTLKAPSFSKEEGVRRHNRIREMMTVNNIDCLIIAGHTGNYKSRSCNLRYVANTAPAYYEEYIVFPLEGEPVYLSWGRPNRISWIPVKAVRDPRSGVGDNYAQNIAARIWELGLDEGTLGIVGMDAMPADLYSQILKKLPKATFTDATSLLLDIRLTKSSEELAFIQKATECADKGFEALRENVKPGVSERELWAAMEKAMYENGAEPPSFIEFGSRAVTADFSNMPLRSYYYGPTDRKLKKGDIITNEIKPSYGGYFAGLVRPIYVGKPPAKVKNLFTALSEIYTILIETEMKPGQVFHEVNLKMTDIAKSKGFSGFMFGSLIHCLEPVGLEIIDGYMRTRQQERMILRPGSTLMVHPAIRTADQSFGGVMGDMVVVTRELPAKRLSKTPCELTVI